MSATAGHAARAGFLARWINPAVLRRNVDIIAVLTAASLPWSTSATGILGGLLFVAVVATLDAGDFLRSLRRPISSLPLGLVLLAIVGTLWSDASWGARLYAISPTAKLLMLPLLLYHFERSERGHWVFNAFLISSILLMCVSWAVAFHPEWTMKPNGNSRGIFVKDYIDQSQEFTLCTVALAYPILQLLRAGRIGQALFLSLVALSLVANMVFVVVARVTFVTLPALLAVFAALHLKWRTTILIAVGGIVLVVLGWVASPELQWRTASLTKEYRLYMERGEATSIGMRLEFWRKSLSFVAEAPIIGHGTGSTRGLFERAVQGSEAMAAGQVIGNPHNQTLNVAVQWGIVGVIVLHAMWIAHLLLFRGEGAVAWIGLAVVLQNFVSSLFNSHLFDFHAGWIYVLGVGVAGGMMLKARRDGRDAGVGW